MKNPFKRVRRDILEMSLAHCTCSGSFNCPRHCPEAYAAEWARHKREIRPPQHRRSIEK